MNTFKNEFIFHHRAPFWPQSALGWWWWGCMGKVCESSGPWLPGHTVRKYKFNAMIIPCWKDGKIRILLNLLQGNKEKDF